MPQTWREWFRAVQSGTQRSILARASRMLLLCGSWPYGLAMWWRNHRFDAKPALVQRVGVPVICVGNLTMGGTGKTVCVEALATWLREAGNAVAILSRGYGCADHG